MRIEETEVLDSVRAAGYDDGVAGLDPVPVSLDPTLEAEYVDGYRAGRAARDETYHPTLEAIHGTG